MHTPAIDVLVRHIVTAGSRVRLDLERTDRGGLIEAEVSRERYREPKLAVGDQAHVRPRTDRGFVS